MLLHIHPFVEHSDHQNMALPNHVENAALARGQAPQAAAQIGSCGGDLRIVQYAPESLLDGIEVSRRTNAPKQSRMSSRSP